MSFDFLDQLQEVGKQIGKQIEKETTNIENQEISQTEIDLAQKLDAVQEFSIDRMEQKTVVLENRKNGETILVERSKLPKDCKEGDIVIAINGKYSLSKERTNEERNRIQKKMNDLWN